MGLICGRLSLCSGYLKRQAVTTATRYPEGGTSKKLDQGTKRDQPRGEGEQQQTERQAKEAKHKTETTGPTHTQRGAQQNQGNKETHRQKHQTKTRQRAQPHKAPRGPHNHRKGKGRQIQCGVQQKESVFNHSNRCTRRRGVHMKQRSGPKKCKKSTSAPVTSMDRHTSTKEIKPQHMHLGDETPVHLSRLWTDTQG